jgi:hypothetical protein
MKAFSPVLLALTLVTATASAAQAADFQVTGTTDSGKRFRTSSSARVVLAAGETLYLRGEDTFSGRLAALRVYRVAGGQHIDVISDRGRFRGRDRDVEIEIQALEETRPGRPAIVELEARGLMGIVELEIHVAPKQAKFDRYSAQASVERAYRAILFRDADPAGASGYVQSIVREGHRGWESALMQIARSGEFLMNVHQKKSSEEILENLYRHLLDRAPDPQGRASFLPMIERGRVGEAAVAIGASKEYIERILGQ